ncbi:MAG TPA: asparagine synthase-related protein [Solirubrobacteraceae bacterium]|nr:asparagine synthase-related protein [Solirubrobacteraceae bacterium]
MGSARALTRHSVRGLSPLELAVGTVLGRASVRPLPPAGAPPLAALEAELLPALTRAPCVVSFSGGRDSSAVLAVAARVARRNGLPDPVPVTIRVPSAPKADEARWQERVIRHLGLDDWQRLEFTDELDLVGPVARAMLERHGLLWPFNAHFHVPMLEAARGGSLLTGIGGDELFRGVSRLRSMTVLTGRARPTWGDARGLLRDLAPAVVRRMWMRRRDHDGDPLPWLTAQGRRCASAAFAAQAADEPLGLRRRVRRVRAMRYLDVGTGALRLLAADAGCAVAHPLLAPRLWSAIADVAPLQGFRSRSAAMDALFGDLLPQELLARTGKAGFNDVFMREPARAFARGWDGSGVPAELVDAAALRRHWADAAPLAQSFTLLQAAWLASSGERLEQPVGAGGERLPAARAREAHDRQ